MDKQSIVELQVENFKRVSAVTLRPNAGVTTIAGRNGQGKSSTLDAIQAALGGKSAAPSKPVKSGAKSSKIVLELSDIIVTRTFSESGKDSLAVAAKDGAKYASPQALLDRLLGSLSFDPLDFERMKPRDQAETLRALVGLDTSALDREHEIVFAERTDVNREVKRIEGELSGIARHADAPDSEVSVAALMGDLAAANAAHASVREIFERADSERDRSKLAKVRADQGRDLVAERRATIAKLEDEIRRYHEAAAKLDTEANDLAQAAAATEAEARDATATLPDVRAIEEKIASADAVNAKVRENARRAATEAKLAGIKADTDAKSARLAAIAAEKAALLADAKFPVPGLGIEGSTVTLDGVPFEQASQAQRLRASVAIGAATNPTFAAMLVRDGSRLDDESLADLATLADEYGVQLIVERVGKGDAMGVVIEDGTVVAVSEAAE